MTYAGAANILNFAPYSKNCNLGQCGHNYVAPIPTLADVQLFVNFGLIQPPAFELTIINLCAPYQSNTATTDCFVIGWNGSYWYGIFKNITSAANYNTFLISLTTGTQTYFSEQYQIPNACDTLTKVSVCYPANYNDEDLNEIFIGSPDPSQTIMGNPAIFYHHNFWTRQGEVRETSNKVTFTASIYKNFASILEKRFEFRPELVPGWYKDYLLSVYFRGDILINDSHALVADLNFEDVDVDYWKAYAVLGKQIKGAFGCTSYVCTTTDCIPVPPPVCIPVYITGSFPNAVVGKAYSASFLFYGSAPFSVSGVTVPTWLSSSLVGNTLTFSGTPTSEDVGSSPIGFTAVNDCGTQPFAGTLNTAFSISLIGTTKDVITPCLRTLEFTITGTPLATVLYNVNFNHDIDGVNGNYNVTLDGTGSGLITLPQTDFLLGAHHYGVTSGSETLTITVPESGSYAYKTFSWTSCTV